MRVRARHAARLLQLQALQSTVGFTAGTLGRVAFGLMLDWAPRLGCIGGRLLRIWGFAVFAAGALVGPFAVGFTEFSHRPERI